jgi:hypothetical protein
VCVGAVEVGDEVGGGFEAPICRLTEVTGRAGVAGCGRHARQRVEGEHLDSGIIVPSGFVENGHDTFLGAMDLIRGVHGGEQALAERGLLATASVAMPSSRGF